MHELFKEYGNIVCITDLGVVINGTLIDYVCMVEPGKIQFWAGNMDEGDNAEQILIEDRELENTLLDKIYENF